MKRKILFFGIVMNLFQVYDDPLQMAKEKYCFVFNSSDILLWTP